MTKHIEAILLTIEEIARETSAHASGAYLLDTTMKARGELEDLLYELMRSRELQRQAEDRCAELITRSTQS